MNPEETLICRIFEQAIEDYKELSSKNIKGGKDNNSSYYSIKDIELFFGGKWCDKLLNMIDSRFTGNDILCKIKTQCI